MLRSIFLGRRNHRGLSEGEIEYCVLAWNVLCGEDHKSLILDEAMHDHSTTRFVEHLNVVYLGANVYPGEGFSANSRMSVLACLAHELSHAERFGRGYRRPLEMPDMLARRQINVCSPCLDEMVRNGEWRIEGARIKRRADVVVFDKSGNLQLVVEAKFIKPDEDTLSRAVQIRRNLLAHSGIPDSPFFLIVFPGHFYLWKKGPTDT